MEIFALFSILITLAAIFSYINTRVLKLHSSIILMPLGTLSALGVIITGHFSSGFTSLVQKELALIDFSDLMLGILLGFLLFSGSLNIDINDLKKSAKSIIVFSVLGTLISTFLVGVGAYYLLLLLHIELPLIYCLMFGALISPTDPIAVMGILKGTNISKATETTIAVESLFNNGIGIIIFATLLQILAIGTENFGAVDVTILFIRGAVGGIITGLAIGFVGYRLMKTIDHYQTEIFISLAMVMGGYSLCHYLQVSGPLAMVAAGIMTGNKGKIHAMSDLTREYLGKFWEVTGEILKALLLLFIGLEIAAVNFKGEYVITGLLVVLLIVTVRFISLFLPTLVFRINSILGIKTLSIMTWGGLRGGISVALALSLPVSTYRDVIVSITFVVVLFSVLAQGFTIKKVITKLN